MLKELRNQHRTIIQMVFSGYKNKEIAERLEMTESTVSQIVRSPLGQAYLEGLQDKAQESILDVRKKLVSLNKSALSVIERVMNPAEKAAHSVQLAAAKDVLDRTGYKAPDRLSVDMTMTTKTDQEIDAEINAMQQSITKTYLQSPERVTLQQADEDIESETSEKETEVFTDEQPQQDALTVDNKDMDSSDQLINTQKSDYQGEQLYLDVNSANSPSSTSEESISLISKEAKEINADLLKQIPVDVFQN